MVGFNVEANDGCFVGLNIGSNVVDILLGVYVGKLFALMDGGDVEIKCISDGFVDGVEVGLSAAVGLFVGNDVGIGIIDGIEIVDYAGFVDLAAEHDKVSAWL